MNEMILVIDLGRVEACYLNALALARDGMSNRFALTAIQAASISWHEVADREYMASAMPRLLREACRKLFAWMRPLDFSGSRAAIRLKCELTDVDEVKQMIAGELEHFIECRMLAEKLACHPAEFADVVGPLRERMERRAGECISQIKELCYIFERL